MLMKVGWDLDDTLEWNQWHYNRAIARMIALILRQAGVRATSLVYITELFSAIDLERRDELGYSKHRFPGSLKETYLRFCKIEGMEPDDDIAQAILQEGYDAFNPERYRESIHKDALHVVRSLAENDAQQHIVTAGDDDVQEGKIAALKEAGILKYFSSWRVVPRGEKAAALEEIAGVFQGPKYFIGNSWVSDMEAALKAEYHGIFIPRFNWEDRNNQSDILAKAIREPRCTVLSELNDVVAYLRRLHEEA